MDIIYVVAPVLLIAIIIAAVWLDRWSVPVILIALGAGIVFGSDVLGLWHFDDIHLVNRLANLALVFILFHGGFSTHQDSLKAVALPAIGLATWGVILTALATFGILYSVFNWSLEISLLLAVIISSTDAAAIFSILRRKPLPEKLSSTVEIESAANDPMAILLTVAVIDAINSGQSSWYMTVLLFIWKFTVAPFIGWFMAQLAIWLFNYLTPQDRSYYYVLALGIMLLIYGFAELLHASGMLAVFVAGHFMGNRPFVHKQGIGNFSASLSAVANVVMFALMGVQVFPHQWADIWLDGLILFLTLTFFARPFAVWLGTAGMHLGWRNRVFIAWAGLRGAVPIILATYPIAAGMPIGEEIFNLVFFAVLLSIAVQGSTLGILARLLKLIEPKKPMPLFSLELITMAATDFDVVIVDLPGPQYAIGSTINDLKLPAGSVIILITRDGQLIIPKGSVHLQGWDQVTVLAHIKDHDKIRSILQNALLLTFE